jgi:hypothetical protein
MTSHGHRKFGIISPEYTAWSNMIARCENPKSTSYKWYGPKGIKICRRWRESFEAFLADMGRRPSKLHSIERMDGDKDYTPQNCYWGTVADQTGNKSNTIRVIVRGVEMPLRRAAKAFGIPYTTVYCRIVKLGWSVSDSLR